MIEERLTHLEERLTHHLGRASGYVEDLVYDAKEAVRKTRLTECAIISEIRKTLLSLSPDQSPCSRASKRLTRSYDIADVLESGSARETPSCIIGRIEDKMMRYNVRMKNDTYDISLGEDFQLHADVRGHVVEFFMYPPTSELFDKSDPAFRMTYAFNTKTWSLRTTTEPSEELISVKHDFDGLFLTIQAQIPALETLEPPTEIESLKPWWDEKEKQWVLKFTVPGILADRRNLQLKLKDGDSAICVFAMNGAETFALDVMSPLSVVQACAVAISTHFWENEPERGFTWY